MNDYDHLNPEGYKPLAHRESWMWTFYEIRTTKGDVTLRWLGESNGYYGKEVDVRWEPNDGDPVSSAWWL